MKDLAMAYGMKRMSKGGSIKCAHGGPIKCDAGCYAEGGEVENEKLSPMSEPKSIAKNIMAMKMAKGGMAEEASEKEEYLSSEDDDSADEVFDHSYPDPDNMEQREGSEHVLDKIMRGLHRKRGK